MQTNEEFKRKITMAALSRADTNKMSDSNRADMLSAVLCNVSNFTLFDKYSVDFFVFKKVHFANFEGAVLQVGRNITSGKVSFNLLCFSYPIEYILEYFPLCKGRYSWSCITKRECKSSRGNLVSLNIFHVLRHNSIKLSMFFQVNKTTTETKGTRWWTFQFMKRARIHMASTSEYLVFSSR